MPRAKSQRILAQFSPYLLQIRNSRIDRFGVFAGKEIPAQRKVIAYEGERISFEEAAIRVWRLAKNGRGRRTYQLRVNRKTVIDGACGGNGAERINHCCTPNVFFRRERGKVFIYSRTRIRKGDELTLDYAFGEEREKIPCRCGSPKCRGYMNQRWKG